MKQYVRIELESLEDRTLEQCQEFVDRLEEIGWLDGWKFRLFTVEDKFNA